MNWIEFVKDYAKKNNIKYNEALKQAKGAWAEHKKKNPTSHSKAKPKKLKMPKAEEKGKSKYVKDKIKYLKKQLAFQKSRL